MNSDQIDLIQASFQRVAPRGPELVASFYRRLFNEHPEVRSLFPHQMEQQQEKLLQTLAYAVNGLKHPESLLPIVRNLGTAHRGYAVKPQHYGFVATALLDALRDIDGHMFTNEVATAWTDCIMLIAKEMEPRLAA